MDQSKIGKFIAALRTERGLTQKELAALLHISDKTVSKWENSRGLPDASLMLPLADALGISVNELLSGERLDDAAYREKAEENMVTLLRRSTGKKLLHLLCSVCCFSLSFVSVALAAGKVLPPEGLMAYVFFSCVLQVANLAAWAVYGVMKGWNRFYVALAGLLDAALIFVTVWLLGITTVVTMATL